MHSIESLTERVELLNRSISSLEARADAISRAQAGISGICTTKQEKENVASKYVTSPTASGSTTTKTKFKAVVTAVVATSAFAASPPITASTEVLSTYKHDEYIPTTPSVGEETENERRMKAISVADNFSSSIFHRCPSSYYSWRLEQRRRVLNAPSVHHLCKSFVMANTKCPHENFSDFKDSRYYLIVVQYTARLHNERLGQAIRSLHEIPPSRKLFNFRLISPEKNEELTGFLHNGVSPLGCKERLPVIISDRIAALNPPFIWLGGGEPDLKWRVSFDDLKKNFNPIIANITYDEVNEDPEPTH